MLRSFQLVLCFVVAGVLCALPARGDSTNYWPNWQKYRTTVQAPTGAIKAGDLARARENLQRYQWAQNYLKSLQEKVDPWLPQLQPAFLEKMVPETTPGATGFTPCPACRDLGKPYLPHGNWKWEPGNPEEVQCHVCKTVFPSEKYPENVVLKTTWGKPQTLTFMGGEPFKLFAYKGNVRPSLSGHIRGQKTNWMTILVSDLAHAYALSGDPKYANAVRAILLRFAQVYPNWLLNTAYGEFADMDPRIAAQNILNLPADELLAPPNTPDRAFHVDFWVAGRMQPSGGESVPLIRLITGYDLTRAAQSKGKALYSDADQLQIERDLLLESTHHLVADKKINNKSVGNRSAAGLIGMLVGEPELVRFGIEGFDLTVNDWFLADGSTPESPAYALMTLGRISSFAQALNGYTDPPGYRDASGKRYDNFDPYRETKYGKVWEAMFKTLQGDFRYPPFADSYVTTSLSVAHAEIIAAAYPERPEYSALVKALLNDDWNNVSPATAIYLAEPGRENSELQPLVLPDNVLPDLRIGFMRTGADGRESLLTLSANHWGGHHHQDSLNLYYWKQGHELLSDLGYLRDHPDSSKVKRTFAHNTVVIDEAAQQTKSRGGDVKYFLTTPHVKAMRAASSAYEQTTVYERASTVIDHGDGRNYAVDVFWVAGGKTQDFVFHGPNKNFQIDVPTTATAAKTYDLKNVRTIEANESAPWRATWDLSEQLQFTAWNLPQTGETASIGDGWGQRDSKNADRSATIPYIVRRTNSTGTSTFVSLFEGHVPGKSVVKTVQRLDVASSQFPVVALQIETPQSRDYVVVSQSAQPLQIKTPDGILKTGGTLAVVSVQNGKSTFVAGDQDASME